jgi:hypothetical protein
MTSADDHHGRSELLLEFARGELDGARSEDLEAHLRSCADCRAELVTVRALLEEPDSPMTADERAELHAALQNSSQQSGNVVPLKARPSSERPFMRRLAPALGAAALLLIGGVAVLQGGLVGSSEDSGGAGGSAGGGQATLEQDAAGAAKLLDGPVWLGDLGRTSLGEVADLARSSPSVEMVRRAYRTAPTAGKKLQREVALVDVLAPQAPVELRDSIRSCIDDISSQFEEPRLFPAVGARGRLEGTKVLFVGFVTSSSGGRPDQLAVWAFEPDSCAPLGYQASPLTTGR